MKAKGIFISALLVIDTFFVSYAAGFHSRHVLVINPKLPPVVQKKVEAKPTTTVIPPKKADAKDAHSHKGHASKSHEPKPTVKPGSTSADKPVSKTATKPATPTKPAPQSTAKSIAKPAAKPEVKPTPKPATKPSSAHPAKPASNSPGA